VSGLYSLLLLYLRKGKRIKNLKIMKTEEHKLRHISLHKNLDELMADFILHTKKLLSETSIMEFLEWSYTQTKEPTEEPTL